MAAPQTFVAELSSNTSIKLVSAVISFMTQISTQILHKSQSYKKKDQSYSFIMINEINISLNTCSFTPCLACFTVMCLLTIDGTHIKVAVVFLGVWAGAEAPTVGWLGVTAASLSPPHSTTTRHAAHTPGLPGSPVAIQLVQRMENNAGNIVMTLTAGNFKLAVLTLIPALSLFIVAPHIITRITY